MARDRNTGKPDLLADPFAERSPPTHRETKHLLGSRFLFESDSTRIMRLVNSAYADLPPQRLPGPTLSLRLRMLELGAPPRQARGDPPAVSMLSGPDLLGGATAGSDAVILNPSRRSGLLLLSDHMLRSAYHARYELLEFAVFTLASRCRGLVSLHGACIGRGGRGVLLMGASGAGKSTVTLLSLTRGFQMVSEDSVFVTPEGLLATGVPNYLHVRSDSLRWLDSSRARRAIQRAPVIRRRSGVKKFELDLRGSGYGLAERALQISAVVFLSARRGRHGARAVRVAKSELRARLAHAQAYAAGQAGWAAFSRAAATAGAYEIERGPHPLDTVEVLDQILSMAVPSPE
jgi:hypothetical protein